MSVPPHLHGVRGVKRERGRDGRRRVARADETRGRRPDWRTSGQEPARILAVEIACPAWRVLCSAAWNRRPSVVVGNPAPPDCTCRQQIVAGGRAKLLECPLDRRVHVGGHVGERRRRIDEVTFGTHRRLLRVRQGLATGIGEEPVERAAEVPHVEPDRRCSAGTFPGVLGLHAGNQVLDVLADLVRCV